MTNCGIYKITNIINNNCYIGSSCNLKKRIYTHFYYLKKNKHKNIYLQNSVMKYGIMNFKWEILKEVERFEDAKKLKEELLKWEQYYLNDFITINKEGIKVIDDNICYNNSLTAGSPLGVKHTLESIANMKKSQKGIAKSKEHRMNLSLSHTGKKHTKEHRKNNSLVKIGREQSEEEKLKRANSNRGKKRSEEFKNKLKKKVINVDSNEIFSSITEASMSCGLKSSSRIGDVCKGKYGCKTTGGYRWSYLN